MHYQCRGNARAVHGRGRLADAARAVDGQRMGIKRVRRLLIGSARIVHGHELCTGGTRVLNAQYTCIARILVNSLCTDCARLVHGHCTGSNLAVLHWHCTGSARVFNGYSTVVQEQCTAPTCIRAVHGLFKGSAFRKCTGSILAVLGKYTATSSARAVPGDCTDSAARVVVPRQVHGHCTSSARASHGKDTGSAQPVQGQ